MRPALILIALAAGFYFYDIQSQPNPDFTASSPSPKASPDTKPDPKPDPKPEDINPDTIVELMPDTLKKTNPTIDKNYLMGRFDPAQDKRFAKISPPLAVTTMYIRKEALEAYKQMHAAAKKDGITFKMTSATRNFDRQKGIWDAKWNSKKPVDGKMLPPLAQLSGKDRALAILRWNAMPGTSRHHWGTDIDMNSVDPSYWAQGKGKKEYDWLVANASKYGFCQTYSTIGADRPTGYQEEKWHWSYMPVASELTRLYGQMIKDDDISGFPGSETAVEIGVVKKYALGINPACK